MRAVSLWAAACTGVPKPAADPAAAAAAGIEPGAVFQIRSSPLSPAEARQWPAWRDKARAV